MVRLIAIILALSCGAFPALAEKRLAFVVGNSNYDAVSSLEHPINDALDISVALEGLGFEVILGSDTTMEELREGTQAFARRAQSADVVLFYFAGHGFQVDGRNYLAPVDAAPSGPGDLNDATMPLDDVLDAMERSQGLKLVFLDACRQNIFGRELGQTPESSSGLARVRTSPYLMLAYATQPNNVAFDGSGRNSYFAEALLNHIYTPGQDLSELMVAIRRDVMAATGGRQIPWDNYSIARSFQFDTSPATTSEETLLWQVAASAKDPNLFQLYVDRYPQGAHVGDVMAFLSTGARTRAIGSVDEETEADRLWGLARRSRIRPLLELYVDRYPEGENIDQARRLLELLPNAEDSSPGSVCERVATHPRDATASTPGVPFERLQQTAETAIQACSQAAAQSPDLPHYTALLARATAASGDLDRAVELYRSAADRGDLRAMVSLAQLYETGTGVPQDTEAALALYERAAEGGSVDAMINLAVALFSGDGVDADQGRAIELLRRAAEGGSAKAAYNLGVLAQDGMIDTPEQAIDYFVRAARDGEYAGYLAAARLLDQGSRVPRDPERAANLLLRGAAEDNGAIRQQLTQAARDWSPQTIGAIQGRLQTAGYYQGRIDGVAGPGFRAALDRWRNGGFLPDLLVE